MNLQQFAALKPGDKISNPMGNSAGVVVSVSDSGVRVRWEPATMDFFYSVNSTAWMHWTCGDIGAN